MHQSGIFDYNSNKEVEYIKYFNKLTSPQTNVTKLSNRVVSGQSNGNRFNLKIGDLVIGFFIIAFGSIISTIVFIVEISIKLIKYGL